VAVRLRKLNDRESEAWGNLMTAGRRWADDDALVEADRLAALVLHQGDPHAEYLEPANNEQFAVLTGSGGVESVVQAIRKKWSFESKPDVLPRELSRLLEKGKKALPGLETRTRTRIYVDLIQMLGDDDETRQEVFREAVLDLSSATAAPADGVRFSADNARRLTNIAQRLSKGYDRNRVWVDARNFPRHLRISANRYLTEFHAYWTHGVQPRLAERDQDLRAIKKALQAGRPTDLDKALRTIGTLKPLLEPRVVFAGKQAGLPHVTTLNQTLESHGETPIKLDLDGIDKLWNHYKSGDNRKDLLDAATALDDAFESLSSGKTDLELYQRSKDPKVIGALGGAGKLKDSWSALEQHPLLDTLIAFSVPTREALEELPANLFAGKWIALLERAERHELKGKFPFQSSGTALDGDVSLAEWDKVKDFLQSAELEFLATMTSGPVDSAIDQRQAEFLNSCADLRDLLFGKEGEEAKEPYSVQLSIVKVRHQKGGTTALLRFNHWRAIFQVGDGPEDTADFTLPVSKNVVGPFAWSPGASVCFHVECWDRDADREGRWLPDLPYRFVPDESNWANILILALGGPDPEAPEPVPGARPVLLTFKHRGTTELGHLVFWFKTEPVALPQRLPDMDAIWDLGR
jgi:hypothetical protein